MPVTIGARGALDSRLASLDEHGPVRADSRAIQRSLTVALLNNMPDPALRDTESQYFNLLQAASGEIPVRLELYSLSQIPRSERAQDYLKGRYYDVRDLLASRVDAVIVTGNEPHQPQLEQEPYWGALVEVFDWAASHTTSAVLSCLAAHASVLYCDGVQRRPLDTKCFGVFEHQRLSAHPLMRDTPELIPFPHSRWNDLRKEDLASCGYTVLLRSTTAGVNMFVKRRGRSLFVHFQGHPEYVAETLFTEYRRDVKRFLRREREVYPHPPHGYFNAVAIELLEQFRKQALSKRHMEIMESFPEADLTASLEHSWHSSSVRIYRNWLEYLLRNAADAPSRNTVAQVGRP